MTNTTHTNRIIQLLVIAFTALVLLLGSGWNAAADARGMIDPCIDSSCEQRPPPPPR